MITPDKPWVRQPAVAGLFYPADPGQLRHVVHGLLQDAAQREPVTPPSTNQINPTASTTKRIQPRALIVPHAGYLYSGYTAACGFFQLMHESVRRNVERVVLIGPAHRVMVQGLATSSAQAFATPLGQVKVDTESVARLCDQSEAVIHDQAHEPEHGLEVELPFLLEVLGTFVVLPLLFGQTGLQQVADVLRPWASDEQTLIVVSSDLSHFLRDEEAQRVDAITARKIEALEAEALQPTDACGHTAVAGLLVVARELGWHCQRLDMRNSGAAEGETARRDRVVGYGSWVLGSESGQTHVDVLNEPRP